MCYVRLLHLQRIEFEKANLQQQFCNFRQPSCIASFATRIPLCSRGVSIPAFESYNIDQINRFTSTIAKFEVFIAAMH